jgi:hypothetical protein
VRFARIICHPPDFDSHPIRLQHLRQARHRHLLLRRRPARLPEPKTFSEKDCHEQAPKEVEELGRGAQVMQKYRASKTLAERAARDLWHANKEKVQ